MADVSDTFINFDNVVKTFPPTNRSVTAATVANQAINIPANSQRIGLTIENNVGNTGITSVTDPSGAIYTLGPGGAQNWNRPKNDLPTGAFVVKHSANNETVVIKEW